MKSRTRPAGSSRRANVSPTRSAFAKDVERPLSSRVGARWIPALIAAAIAVALYLPSLGYDFVRDDQELIRANAFLRRDGWLMKLLTSDFWGASSRNSGMWRPLVVLSYWVDGRVFQWQPWGFHAVNIAAHVVASAIVAALVSFAGAPAIAAALAGAWFAAMPAHVESVAWISGRTDILCGAAFGLALLLDRRARREGTRWPGVLPVLAFALALLAKEAALPFIAVVAVAEWVDARGGRWDARATARWLAPYAVVTALFLLAHEALSARWTSPPSVDPVAATQIRWAGWIMLPHYVAMMWPGYPHSPDIALALPSGGADPRVLWGLPLTLALVAIAGVATWKRWRAALPLAVWVLPLLTFPVLAWVRGYLTFAERLVYLPSIGIAWLLGMGIEAARTRGGPARTAAVVAASVLIIASAWVTVRLVPEWKNDFTMFESIVRVQPDNVRARVGWANQLGAAGRDAEALEQLALAEQKDPQLSEIAASRAVIYFRHGDWPKVHENASRALALDPTNPQARLLEATALMRMRRLDEASTLLQRLMAEQPGNPAIEGIWGQVLLLRGDPAGAVPFLTRAAAWENDDASVTYALGMACQLTEQWSQARDAFAQTVRLDPTYLEGWIRLARAAHRAQDPATLDRALTTARELPGGEQAVAELRKELGRSP